MTSFPWRAVLRAALLIAVAAGVVAAFIPEPVERLTVEEIVAERPYRRLVVLEGTVHSAAPNRLLLSDGTGKIRLNTCPAWYWPMEFGRRERVRVTGHLAPPQTWRNNNPIFLVYRIRGEYGKHLTLRHSDGVPVWHRHRNLPGRRLQWEISREMASVNWPQTPWTP